MDLKALIEKERASFETPASDSLNVALGGELVKVTVSRLRPDMWQALTALHPPRKGVSSDANLGYNQSALPSTYPAESLLVNAEPVDAETWAEMYAVLNSVHRNNLSAVIWGLNVLAAITELRELGKAAAGQPSSLPANRESRRAVSKAGSRQK